jgi:FkbM family methyltransferase
LTVSQYNHRDSILSIYHPATLPNRWFGSVLEGIEYPKPPCLSSRHAVIVDVGANIGISTIHFALNYTEARIWALEPSSNSFRCLQYNTEAFPNVKPLRVGLYSSDCEKTLYYGKSCVTDSVIHHCHSGIGSETVSLRRASALFSELLGARHVSILKVDTEGCELPILQDLEDWLCHIDCLFYEYHSDEDRFRLDCLLSSHFYVFHSRIDSVHRGTVGMVAKRLADDHPALNATRVTG